LHPTSCERPDEAQQRDQTIGGVTGEAFDERGRQPVVIDRGHERGARAIRQNDVVVKLSRHHLRQRSTVRRSTPIIWSSSRMRRAVAPCRRIAISTTIAAM